ncbi:MAG: hypothetical protein P8J86_10575 [Phycisphaerales bacterium]|nr:hypothetical protein [Phycisphaerales bacterium]
MKKINKCHFTFLPALLLVVLIALATKAQAQGTAGRYITIPVDGQIGIDTLAEGFSETLRIARANRSNTTLVLTFDSDGGSEIEAKRIIDILEQTGDRYQRIGIVKKCIGPALGILLTCDKIFIADPRPEGTILEFHAAWTHGSGTNEQAITRQQNLYRTLVADMPSWKPVIDAMIDPNVDLYAWKTESGQVRASNTRPDVPEEVKHIDLTEALGITASTAIAAGLAKQLEGGMDGLGHALGFETFRPSQTSGAILMQAAVKTQLQHEGRVETTFAKAFNLISSAQDLINDLPRQEYFAQQADPRNIRYRSRYVRTWAGSRWRFTGPSVRIWRTNSDNAIQQWQTLVNSLDRIGQLGTQARVEVNWLKEQAANWNTNDPRLDGLALLEKDLDELVSTGKSLQVMRDQAASQIDFFQRNRNTPAV